MSKVAFLGGGSFGTALAIMLAKKGISVNIWDRKLNVINDINIKRENIKYLPSITVPAGITAFTVIEKVISDSEIIVLSVPSHAIRDLSRMIAPYLKQNQIVVSIAKGIEEGSSKRISQVIEEEILSNPIVILSGPSHAEEVALDIPTTVVVTSKKMEFAKIVQDVFMTSKFRVYTNEDIIGVEIGGAVKNIIALAAGGVCLMV